MCRVIVASRDALMEYDKKHNLLLLLQHLEKECGGHGNGLSLVGVAANGMTDIRTTKGTKYTVKSAYEDIIKNKFADYVVFHTRIASVSDVSDARCHPFNIRNGNAAFPWGVAAMNGTMYDTIKDIADVMGITDTEVVLNIAKQAKSERDFVDVLDATGQVWVGVIGDKPFALKGNGALVQVNTKEGFMFCSSLPQNAEKSRIVLNDGFSWMDGEVLCNGVIPLNTSGYVGWGNTKYVPMTNTYEYIEDDLGSYYEHKYVGSHDQEPGASILKDFIPDDADLSDPETAYFDGYDRGFEHGYEEALREVKL
jgi:hypothetical protein